jgi:hypothetical protein
MWTKKEENMRRKMLTWSMLAALALGALTACGATTDDGTGTGIDSSVAPAASDGMMMESPPADDMMMSPAASDDMMTESPAPSP